jgi:ferredoxin
MGGGHSVALLGGHRVIPARGRVVMKVRIDTAVCTGHGRCYSLAPEVFQSDDSGYGSVPVEDVPEDLRAKAEIGVQNCPERAISID